MRRAPKCFDWPSGIWRRDAHPWLESDRAAAGVAKQWVTASSQLSAISCRRGEAAFG
jgi:hypothetical protein